MSEENKVFVRVIRNADKIKIIGYINDDDVISINNHINGKWHVGHSSTLGSDVEYAKLKSEAFTEVFKKFDEIVGDSEIYKMQKENAILKKKLAEKS